MSSKFQKGRVQGYLNRRSFMMFMAEASMMLRGESEHLSEIVNTHQSKMSESNQKMLLDKFRELETKEMPT